MKEDKTMTVFFTADQHFGHENIIKYCNRPFSSVGEMDEALINQWNSTVGKMDIVYHLGDFTLSDRKTAREYWRRLNGIVYVLANPWHHDRRWLPSYQFGEIAPECGTRNGIAVGLRPPLWILEFPEIGDGQHPQVVALCHYPLAVWDRRHYGAWHLHGHSHGNHHGEGKILDVGVDNADFTGYAPICLETVAEIMATKSDDF
jgi:calcineurin-like phosphoesterase family protein